MNKLALTFMVFGLLVSEANAGKKCQCKYKPTSHTSCEPMNYTGCLGYNMTCEAWGKQMGNDVCGRDLECTQIGTCSD